MKWTKRTCRARTSPHSWVEHFVNRAQVKEEIEKRGGKVTGSVTSKTNYLINNDTGSGTAKNKKARELGIPIISEEDFLQMMNE